jgi:hypothetical protein
MNVTEKENLYDEIIALEKSIRKKHPKQSGRVIIANIKSKLDMVVGRMNNHNEIQWIMSYKDELKKVV